MGGPNMLQTVFAIFYAIFWGVMANAQPKWRAFNWPVAFKYPRTRRRLAVALLLLDIAPILVFIAFFLLLAEVSFDAGRWEVPLLGALRLPGALQLLLVVVAANAPFAVHRLWIGILEHRPEKYYYRTSEEPDLLPAFEPKLFDPGPHSVSLSAAWSGKNLLVSTVHLIVCLAAVGALHTGGVLMPIVGGVVLLILVFVGFWAWRDDEREVSTASRQELLAEAFRAHEWHKVLRICAEEIEGAPLKSVPKGVAQ